MKTKITASMILLVILSMVASTVLIGCSTPADEPTTSEDPAEPAEPAKAEAPAASAGDVDVEGLRNEAMEFFNSEEYEKAEVAWKKLLEIDPEDKQAQEMLETTQMLIEALQ